LRRCRGDDEFESRAGGAPVRGAISQLHGQMPRRIFQRFQNPGHGVFVQLMDRPAETNAGLNLAILIENRSAHAARAEVVLFIVDGITERSNFFQFLQEAPKTRDGFGSSFLHRALSENLL